MEMLARTAGTEQGVKAAMAILDDYRQLVFPGTGKGEDTKLTQMRKMVEAEAGKVYILGQDDMLSRQTLNNALESDNPNLAAWAAREVHKENMAKARLHKDLKRSQPSSPRLPKGTPHIKM
jgi:UDP-N-acetylmuramoylalanine-D-glutamate ligase